MLCTVKYRPATACATNNPPRGHITLENKTRHNKLESRTDDSSSDTPVFICRLQHIFGAPFGTLLPRALTFSYK
jgi:hypothetical protein